MFGLGCEKSLGGYVFISEEEKNLFHMSNTYQLFDNTIQ